MCASKKIRKGFYEYKGYHLQYFGYYPPERSVWWEAVDETGSTEFHAHTKKELINLINNDNK